jgi:hypothetical protein
MSGDGDMSEVGHNNPPEVLELASEVIDLISAHMADYPVVEREDDARLMKAYIDRAKLCVKDLEVEQEVKSKPLRDHLETIRSDYRPKRRMLGDLLDEMVARVQIFVKAEQHRREQAAALLVAQAHEARRNAEAAERIEAEQLDNASKGEYGVDVAQVIAEADDAFEAYEKAERQAVRAEKDTRVKIGGGFSRAIGMRKKETLSVPDVRYATAALNEMGLTHDIHEAILKSARAYRTVHGKLPEGVISKVEEHL